jgi:hypothetical protein
LSRSVMEQVKSGLWLGLGCLAMPVGLGATLGGVSLVLPDTTVPHLLWSTIGLLGIVLGLVILLLSANIWYKLLAGCFLFGSVKALFSLLTGRYFYSPHEPFSRLISAQIILFGALILWFGLQVEGKKFTVLDRFAITLTALAGLWFLEGKQSLWVFVTPLALAVGVLLMAGLAHRRHSHRAHG